MSKKSADLSANFCVMPWTNLATETNGKCKICCVVMTNRYIKKDDGSDFEIQTDQIEDIWNSNYIKNVRKKMLAGEWVSDCFYCKGQEERNQKSPRQSYNETWFENSIYEKALYSDNNDGYVAALPTSLEPRPGILCNLKCNMCWSMSSSKILSERMAAVENNNQLLPDFLKQEWTQEVQWAKASDFGWSEKEQYIENFKKCIPTLRRLYFTGGEPTLIKSNLSALKQMIQVGKTDLLISFTTNLQTLPAEWLDILPRFSRVEITASIDGFGKANEYIRFPSQWKNVSDNLQKLYDMYPKIFLSIIYVVQASNVLSYIDLIRWISKKFPERQIQVIPTMLQGPSFLQADILDLKMQQKAIDCINEALLDASILEKNLEYLADIKSQISKQNQNASDLRNKFREYILYLDRTRNINFSEAFPEMASILD